MGIAPVISGVVPRSFDVSVDSPVAVELLYATFSRQDYWLARLATLNGSTTLESLIVDDDQAIADTLAVIFRMHGYSALVAYSAEQAIERIASSIPDLALLDVNLPGMNGIDLAIVLKANHPECHLLLVSGHESTRGLLEEAMIDIKGATRALAVSLEEAQADRLQVTIEYQEMPISQ